MPLSPFRIAVIRLGGTRYRLAFAVIPSGFRNSSLRISQEAPAAFHFFHRRHLLMIIRNFHVARTVILPCKTNPPGGTCILRKPSEAYAGDFAIQTDLLTPGSYRLAEKH